MSPPIIPMATIRPTPNFFATALTNGPLTAPASSTSGGNGVYAYGSTSLFPTNSFNATSYGVDVLFKPQLARIGM